MPITSFTSDATSKTLLIVANYPFTLERLWEAYSDPRQIERFWGPREWPSTFTRHDMAVGGESHYKMKGPDGSEPRGMFRFLRIEPLRLMEVQDVFANADGSVDDSKPTMRMVFEFEATDAGSRYTSRAFFDSIEAMKSLVEMGMIEGTRSAMSQIDEVLADNTSFAAARATHAQLLSATQVRVSRVICGTIEKVWRAYQDASLMQRWLLGPDGWTMPICEVATEVGQPYRYEWATVDGTQQFGFEGELLESQVPYRLVTNERMIGTDGPSVRNELTLTTLPTGVLMSLLITYPDQATRDMILATGMTEGMETSFVRLEQEVLVSL